MEEQINQENIEEGAGLEFHNYWKDFQHFKRIEIFTVSWMDNVFAFSNALSVVIFNFEFRFYFKK